MSYRSLFYLFLFSCILIGCDTPTISEDTNNTSANTVSTTIDSLSTAIRRAPVETKGGVPIYDFEHFKPFMEAKNDTTYVVNFWATWCSPCVAELPYFNQLAKKYEGKKVRFIFVSLDFEKKIEEKLVPFLVTNELRGEVLLLQQKGMNDWIDQIDPNWSGAIPATLIYNQEGSHFYAQSFDYAELEKAFLTHFN